MADNDKSVSVKVSDNDLGFALLLIFLVLACYGDPDLLDVLQEWCRRYINGRTP